MAKLLILLALLSVACVSPSPEAQAPVNIRVYCGEDKEPKVETPQYEIESKPAPFVTPEESQRFWELTPGNTLVPGTTTTPLVCKGDVCW